MRLKLNPGDGEGLERDKEMQAVHVLLSAANWGHPPSLVTHSHCTQEGTGQLWASPQSAHYGAPSDDPPGEWDSRWGQGWL